MFYFALPLGMEHRTRKVPMVTLALIGLNLLMYFLTLALGWHGGTEREEWMHRHLWLIPAHSGWFAFLSSLFMNQGISALAGNMIYLFLFGACMEDVMGRTRFTFFYLLGGLIGNLAQITVTPGHFASTPVLGGPAGGITGCMGAFLVLRTRTRVEFQSVTVIFRDFSVTTRIFLVPAWIIISIWMIADVVMLVLTRMGKIGDGGMMFGAHSAGFLWGLGAACLIKFLPRRQPQQPEALSKLPLQTEGETRRTDESAAIYLFADQAQSGPLTATQVREMLVSGSLQDDALYWRQGMAEWRSVMELRSS